MNSTVLINEVLSALRKLGYTVNSNDLICIGLKGDSRTEVYLRNEYFGIWDSDRKTFVD